MAHTDGPRTDDPLGRLARTEGVPSAVASARDAADAVLRDRGLRAISPEVSARALLAAARASAAIEADDGRDWTAGSVRLSTELVGLAAEFRGEPGRVLARLHTLAARGVLDDDALGRLQRPAAGRMADLYALIAGRTAAPALVLGAVVHAEIASTRAFGPGSGLVARAAERLVQIGSGLDPAGVLVPEAGHLAAGASYHAALAGYAAGGTGVRAWILHCADAFAHGVEVSPVRQN